MLYLYYKYLRVKIVLTMAWYRVFNPELYRHGKALQKSLKSPEVQEALDKTFRAIINELGLEKDH